MPTHRNRDKDKRKSREKPCEKESCNDNCFYITVQDEGGQTKRCSRYCHRHTCQAGVSENAQDRCLELKFKTGKLCNNHRKCGSTGCDQSGENPNQELPFFCPQHQCQRNGCLMQCYRHTGGCKDHLCARQGCPYPSDADRGGIFCRTHICRSRDCMNGTHENNGLCHAHLPCSHHGCNASRKAVDGNRRNFELHCAQHMPCQAMSCKEFAGQGHKFCIRHRCHLSDCMKQSEDGCEFCDDHTCHEPGCPLPIHIMNDSNSRYCAYHCCQIEDCFEKSSNMSGYCRSHTCEAADCLEGRVEPTRFCSKHKCQDPGCHYGAMAAGGYCHIHGCHETDCCERAIGGPVSVQHCVEHLREQSRQAGYDEATQEHKQKEAKSLAKIEELKKEIEELKRDREELKTDNEELKRDSEVLRTDNEDLWRTIDNMRIRGAHNPESAWAYRPPESSHTPWRESAGQSRVYERPRQSRTDDIPDTYGHWPHPTQFRRGFRQ